MTSSLQRRRFVAQSRQRVVDADGLRCIDSITFVLCCRANDTEEQALAANWTNQQVLNQLDTGYKWTAQTITYAFPTTAAGMEYFYDENFGFRAISSAQQAPFKQAIQAWDDLIPQTFQQTFQSAPTSSLPSPVQASTMRTRISRTSGAHRSKPPNSVSRR